MKSDMTRTPVQLTLPLEVQLGLLNACFRDTHARPLPVAPPLAIPWPPKKKPAPWGAGGGSKGL